MKNCGKISPRLTWHFSEYERLHTLRPRLKEQLQRMILTDDLSPNEDEIVEGERLNVLDIAHGNDIVDPKWNVPEMQPIVLVQRISCRKDVNSD